MLPCPDGMTGPKTPEDLLDSAETLAAETSKVPARGTTYTAGQLIDKKYRLLRPLGEGGMASVWVAHNEMLDIHVAIKFIRADLQAEGLANRLLQEARAAARLGHPAIVRVSDFGTTPKGDPYIVMELLNGEDLGAVIKRKGPMQALRAVRTILPIADALAVAHGKKIVHRDLKPENIFLVQTESGKTQPKLVDFGIAKLEREDSQRITQIGAAMGSPAYMSPEQARGLDVDARTDIWALCVVLYEILTARLPFNGNSYTALVVAILESRPTPTTALGSGDAALWGIIEKGLEKDPDRRWQSMRELGTALARWALALSAADDITGSNLQSSWIERPPDSIPAGSPSLLPQTPSLPSPSAGSVSGPAATQLSATVSSPARGRSLSTLLLAGALGIVLLGLVIGFAIRATLPKETPAREPARVPDPPAPIAVVPAPRPSVEPLVPSVAPSPSTSAASLPSAAPGVDAKRPAPKPKDKPTTKPSEKPESGKPAEKPKPAEKDPLDQLKTF